MTNNSNDSQLDELWRALDRLATMGSVAVIAVLTFIYFQLPAWTSLNQQWRDFLSAIITNLIPVYFLFVVSYVLLRQIQRVRYKSDAKELANQVASEIKFSLLTKEILSPEFINRTVIKSRDEITVANRDLISSANESIISFSGDLSWTEKCNDALADSVTRGISVKILCKEPLTDESKKHVKRYLGEAGLQIKYYPQGFDPDVRGLMVDVATSKRALFVEKKHKILGDNYQRTGKEGDTTNYEYWGQYFDAESGLALVSPLAKLFDVLWKEAEQPQIIYEGDWFNVERELRLVKQYQTAKISFRSVKVANVRPLHRFIDLHEFERIQTLARTLNTHNIPLWRTVTVVSSRGQKTICPPVIEVHNGQWIVIDGLSRVYFARQKKMSEVFACVVEDVSEPLIGAPWTWDKIQLVTSSDYVRSDNFQNLDEQYWRELDSVHTALERISPRS